MSSLARTYFILLSLSLACLVVGYLLGNREGFVLGFFVAAGLWIVSIFRSEKRIEDTYSSRPLRGQDAWHLEKMLSQLSLQARIPQPRLMILDIALPTALSTGRTWLNSTIYLSDGLLKSLTLDEVHAVLAHEVARIQRRDTLLCGVAGVLSDLLLSVARFFDGLGQSRRNIAEELFAPIASLPLRLFVRPNSFFETDKQAAQILGDPKTLARVLWKLDSCSGAKPLADFPTAAPLFIVGPLTSRNHHRYFLRQPPVAERIERLVGHFPI